MLFIALVTALLLLAGFAEEALHRRALAKIPLRILVNGTRGKTTVTRMVASVLREAGIKTYAKTTGSDARRILPDGSESAYRRRGVVSLMEQLPFVRLARRGGAGAIVVECMALRAENQHLMAEKLVRPNYVLLTNAFVDHVEEIGATEAETVRTLALSVPEDAVLIAGDARFGAHHAALVLPEEAVDMRPFEGCSFTVHEENARLVFALADQLRIDRDTAVRGVLRAEPDIGMRKGFTVGGVAVVNSFAVNDPKSFAEGIAACGRRGAYALLFNHREDRAYRMEAFARVLREAERPPACVGVIGQDRVWAAKYLARATGLPCGAVANPRAWLDERGRAGQAQLVCAGNIKGEGRAFLEALMKETAEHV